MKRILRTVLVLGISLSSLFPSSVSAAPVDLSISPTKTQLSVAAGASVDQSLKVTNSTDHDLDVDMYAQAFFVTDKTYNYTFSETSPLNQWVHFSPGTFTLKTHQTQTVTYTLGVPAKATPGGKYFSLFAATTAKPEDGVTTSERVGSLVYLTVPGDTSYTGRLLGLQTPVVAFSAIDWSEVVNNTGANYFTSQYSTTLKTPWGSTVSDNEGSTLLISSSVHLISGTLNAPRWLGLYKVSASFGLANSGTATDSRWVLYLPPVQLIGLLIILGAIIIAIVRVRIRRKKINT